ncbi:hypothetical protein [Oxalicibacterium solurbis]|uniref:hypothetical protein n=1 Tax=Oxalicibacterium solurbis TaxID=69280 RepID=UPI00166F3A62|nr:hypothetical protein [Oxalicibacterium solurbis]
MPVMAAKPHINKDRRERRQYDSFDRCRCGPMHIFLAWNARALLQRQAVAIFRRLRNCHPRIQLFFRAHLFRFSAVISIMGLPQRAMLPLRYALVIPIMKGPSHEHHDFQLFDAVLAARSSERTQRIRN